jgi:hypothetical protein
MDIAVYETVKHKSIYIFIAKLVAYHVAALFINGKYPAWVRSAFNPSR